MHAGCISEAGRMRVPRVNKDRPAQEAHDASLEMSLLGALGSMGPVPPRCNFGAARTSDANPSLPPAAPSDALRLLKLAGRPEPLAPCVWRGGRWPRGLSVSWRLWKKGDQLPWSESWWLGDSSAPSDCVEPAAPASRRYACVPRTSRSALCRSLAYKERWRTPTRKQLSSHKAAQGAHGDAH